MTSEVLLLSQFDGQTASQRLELSLDLQEDVEVGRIEQRRQDDGTSESALADDTDCSEAVSITYGDGYFNVRMECPIGYVSAVDQVLSNVYIQISNAPVGISLEHIETVTSEDVK